MRKICHEKTLVYYDGPVLFEGRDVIGGHYIGMAVTTPEDEDAFVVAGVAPERLRQFRNGVIDLLALLKDRDDPTWYLAQPAEDGYEYCLQEQSYPIAETDFLPDPGFVLHDCPAKSHIVQMARERNHLVCEFSVDPPETSFEHRIRATTLASLLTLLQTLVKHAYNRSLRPLSTAEKKDVDRNDAHQLDVLVPAAAGSFAVIMGPSNESNDLFCHSELSRGLTIVDELFQNVSDPSGSVETAKQYRGHLAGAYLRLLNFLQERKTGLACAWAEPCDELPHLFKISEGQVGPIVKLLTAVADLGSETVELVGTLEKADATQGSWSLKTEEKKVNGRTRNSGPGVDGLVIRRRYRFICDEVIEAVEISEAERKTLYLSSVEPLD